VTYRYNAFGQMSEMITPSGQLIAYSYGAPSAANPGKVVGVTVNGVDLIKSADYRPFGPTEGWDWGNSCTGPAATCNATSSPPINQNVRAFDLNYRPITIGNDPEGYYRNLAWDRANRITGITIPSGVTVPGVLNSQTLNQAYAYDALDRLTQFNAGVSGAMSAAAGLALLPNETFTYDGIGNRKSRTTQAPGATSTQSTSYAHGTTNHWLTASTGSQANSWAYDASGNTTYEANAPMWGGYGSTPAAPASNVYAATSTGTQAKSIASTYDAKNRLTKVAIANANTPEATTQTSADTVTYRINALGQRVQKIGAGIFAPPATNPTNPFAITLSNPPTALQLQSLNAQTQIEFEFEFEFEFPPTRRTVGCRMTTTPCHYQ
jgi:hypothetical protein